MPYKPAPTQPLKGKKILIIHFRVGKTDGVSIEIDSWKEILEKLGAEIKLCSGPVNNGASYIIEELEQQLNPRIFALDEHAYGRSNNFQNEAEFVKELSKHQKILKNKLIRVLNDFKPDHLIISNIFSVGEHFGAAAVFTEVLDELKIPTLAVHHDFHWEQCRYAKPTYDFVSEQLESYFPPNRPWLKHACINQIAQESLLEKRGIESAIIYDTLDFKQTLWEKDKYNGDILSGLGIDKNDVIILQATRIVRRKNIEIAIDLVNLLSKPGYRKQLAEKTLYHNKQFDPVKNKIVFIAAGYAEQRDQEYLQKLMGYSAKKGVVAHFIADRIDSRRNKKNSEKKYSLWDIYPYADFITYPSIYEGFGNQFLEAVFAGKLAAVFEYPVFKSDIKNKGFNYISLGDQIAYKSDGLSEIPKETADKAVKEIIYYLTHPEKYHQLTDENFILGDRYFSHEVAAQILTRLLLTDPITLALSKVHTLTNTKN
jgi:mannosylglucosylglycerate synthase